MLEMTGTADGKVDEPELKLTENARIVLMKRYVRRGPDGKPIETPEGMFRRVARAIAEPEAQHGGDVAAAERAFYRLLTELRFFPNSPTFTGAGTPLGQLAACFVIPISDDMGRKSDGIFQTLRDAALIQQTGGGNGFAFSRLRPKGAHVKTSAGNATGPVGFLRVYDKSFGEIAQGGSRRGANMGVLRVDHPDVEEFITCKTDENAITNFNISVGVTDAFMAAVRRDEEWELRFPDVESPQYRGLNGTLEQAEQAGLPIKVHKRVRARELFDQIVKQAHHNGEPGVLFLDAANRENPVPHLYQLEATNPCHRGSNLIHTDQGAVPIRDLVGCDFNVITPDGTIARARAFSTGIKPLFRVHLENGASIDLTEKHNLIMADGSKRAVRDLKPGDRLKLAEYPIEPAHALYQHSGAEIGFMEGSAKQAAAEAMLDRRWRDTHSAADTAVIRVEDLHLSEEVYNLTVDHPSHQFAANGIVSANCGEQFLGSYENCCLGSINLAQHVKHVNGKAQVDWAKLEESILLSTHFLDNVVTANQYVPAVPQLQEAAHRARRIGLGIMGLGDLMYHLGVRYGSPEAQEFAAQVMEFVRYHCMKTSIGLARERGPFPAIEGSLYDPHNLKWTPPTPLEPYAHDWCRPPIRWHEIVEGIQQHGIRNAAQTTVAPTGTIATVAGCEAYGCEPAFALAYLRHVVDAQAGGDGRTTLTYASPLFEQALIGAGVDEATRERIYAEALYTGTCQNIAEVPESVRRAFVVSADITPEEHVRMQAAIQRFVDNSISKCVTGDTLVLTTQGLTPITELSELRLPDQFEPMALDVITPSGIERADAFYYGGMRETRRVRLSYGYQVEGTLNHRIQVLAGDGCIHFARLDELKVGDTVVLYGSQQVFGPAGQSLPQYRGEYLTNAKPVTFPERMSSELAYVLGCITSEGAICRNGVMITNGDRSLLERLATLFERLFGLSSHISQDTRRESVYTLQVNSRALRNWLLADLGMEAGARNKIIPTCILRASRREIAAFLRGLLLDGYMTRDGRLFGIGLASRALLQQLQVLFLNFGVVSRLHRSAEHAWTLTVSGDALERLAAFVEFDEVWKSDRIALRHEGRTHRLFNYADLLPGELTRALRHMQEASANSLRSLYGEQTPEYQRARVNLLQGHRLDRQMAAALYYHFGDATDAYANAFFADDRQGCLYVDVESVESGFSEVFDLSVPGSHTFVANGLGNHNTCNFPENATQADVAQAYFLAWELGCKGLTVYVTGSRDKVVLETQQTKAAKEKPAEIASAEAPVTKKPRPRKLAGSTYKIGTPLGTAFITVNENGDGKPFEIFLNVGKAGSDTAAVAEALGRLISLVLRLPSPMDPTERLQNVVEQLAGIGGGRPMGFGLQRVRSLPDGIAQALIEYLGQSSEPAHADGSGNGHLAAHVEAHAHQLPLKIGDLCPACGEAAFVNEEGCRKCYNCGHSEC